MQESFLHYVWQMQYFDKRDLLTTKGDKVDIFQPGFLNTNAGPDFSNARLKIGEIDWVGNVEVHTLSSGWMDHHHDQDAAYDNVILHVVWKLDKEIVRRDMTLLPTLELRTRVEESLIRSYRQLIGSSFSVPCQRSLRDVEEVVKVSMLEKTVLQRLERKSMEVHSVLEYCGNDWEEAFYQLLARNFGFKVNADPFFQLAKTVPLRLLRKHAGQLTQVEALLFGQAGFLETTKGDGYYMKLRQEYRLLAHKFGLDETRMSRSQWRFLRLRPANFPPLRLAQFAAILHHRPDLFSRALETETLESLIDMMAVHPSDYWISHYQFSKTTRKRVHELGKASIESIVINTFVPMWVAYGKRLDDQGFVDRALRILEQLPMEENRITHRWQELGLTARNAADSQALIELFNTFCQRKNCLNCNIGASLIRPIQK